ncbi:MAG: vWA domain-containing protein [Acidobacteriota bacterium]
MPTDLVFILDRSGSMEPVKQQVIEGFNALLESQKNGQVSLTLVLFDDQYELIHNGLPLERVRPLNGETFRPDGTTALLDAIGETLDTLDVRLGQLPQDPEQVIVAVLTDGTDDASVNYTRKAIAGLIRNRQEERNWVFLLVASSRNITQVTEDLSLPVENTMDFVHTGESVLHALDRLDDHIRELRSR